MRFLLNFALATGILFAAAAGVFPHSAEARDCYKESKLKVTPEPLAKELFVFIDETTVLDESIRQAVVKQVTALVDNNSAFQVAKFSAFIKGHYAEVIGSGRVDGDIPAKVRDDEAPVKLRAFDTCRVLSLKESKTTAMQLTQATMASANTGIAKSDIMMALKDLSEPVRNSKAERRIVLLVSDMLENSSLSSFYSKNNVRQIDPNAEMAKVEKGGMLGDFGGAEIYVVGAGIIPETGKALETYRSSPTMGALESFWRSYFAEANSSLRGFGKPALLEQIK